MPYATLLRSVHHMLKIWGMDVITHTYGRRLIYCLSLRFYQHTHGSFDDDGVSGVWHIWYPVLTPPIDVQVGFDLVIVKTTVFQSHHFHTHQTIQGRLMAYEWRWCHPEINHSHHAKNISPQNNSNDSDWVCIDLQWKSTAWTLKNWMILVSTSTDSIFKAWSSI